MSKQPRGPGTSQAAGQRKGEGPAERGSEGAGPWGTATAVRAGRRREPVPRTAVVQWRPVGSARLTPRDAPAMSEPRTVDQADEHHATEPHAVAIDGLSSQD